ncbi:MAG: phosphoglycerate kinase [Neisseriales bacterium]|nr:MAG: phosphoglycerate kinase [Neisseriales bacterium]
MPYLQLAKLNVAGKRVLIRVDMNVPLQDNGAISDDTRIRASLPSIQYCLQQNASAVIIMTHLGRPIEGSPKTKDSILPIAKRLSELLQRPVAIIQQWSEAIQLAPNSVVMLENVRLNIGEKENDPDLSQRYAKLCDVFVHDAFGTAHRIEASTYGVAKFAPVACAGFLLHQEIATLSLALSKPAHPLLAIVAGAKISTKLSILNALADKVDQLVVGGSIANTFLLASGYDIGASLAESAYLNEAKSIMDNMQRRHGLVPLPSDVIVTKNISADATAVLKNIADILPEDKIVDFGSRSIALLLQLIRQAKMIVWNGPIGVFEIAPFSHGTRALAEAIGASDAFSIAGGGETIAAVTQFKVADKMSYLSTGGGAFLAFLEGKTLPAIAILSARFND